MTIEKHCKNCDKETPRYANGRCKPCKAKYLADYQKRTGYKHRKAWGNRNPLKVAEYQLRAAQNRLERLRMKEGGE